MRTVRFMFAEENRGKEIKERIQKDLKQYKKAVILTGMSLEQADSVSDLVCPSEFYLEFHVQAAV